MSVTGQAVELGNDDQSGIGIERGWLHRLFIRQCLGISVRSLQRHFADHGTKKGGIKKEVPDSARADLLKRVTSDEAIKEEAARLVNDNLVRAQMFRTFHAVSPDAESGFRAARTRRDTKVPTSHRRVKLATIARRRSFDQWPSAGRRALLIAHAVGIATPINARLAGHIE